MGVDATDLVTVKWDRKLGYLSIFGTGTLSALLPCLAVQAVWYPPCTVGSLVHWAVRIPLLALPCSWRTDVPITIWLLPRAVVAPRLGEGHISEQEGLGQRKVGSGCPQHWVGGLDLPQGGSRTNGLFSLVL